MQLQLAVQKPAPGQLREKMAKKTNINGSLVPDEFSKEGWRGGERENAARCGASESRTPGCLELNFGSQRG